MHPPREGAGCPRCPGNGNINPCHLAERGQLVTPQPSAAPSHGNASPANPNGPKTNTFSQQNTQAHGLQWGSTRNAARAEPW